MRYRVQQRCKGDLFSPLYLTPRIRLHTSSMMPCMAAVQGRFSAFDIQCIPSICKKQFNKFCFTKSYFTKL